MDFTLPQIGEGVYEGEIVRWLVRPGERVQRGQGLLEILTDKATSEVPAPFAGVVTELLHEVGATVKVGERILRYSVSDEASAIAAHPKRAVALVESLSPPPMPVASAAPAVEGNRNGHSGGRPAPAAAPSVRHLARKLGIDLAQVCGSGPGGRILLDDLTPLLQKPNEPLQPKPAPEFEVGTPGTKIRFQGIRRRIAEHMVAAKRSIPHFTYVDECDLTELVKLRAALKDTFARKGVKLTYLPFFIKATARALKDVPIVNSSLDEVHEEIVLHNHYDIGIAVATPTGLVVPVIKGADRKDILSIAREVDQLSSAARAGKAKRDDLRGSTFTLTSIGSIGGLFATPIINHPEVGILGIGKIVKRPVFDAHDNVVAAHMGYLSFSFDHRVIDGAICALFANALIKHLTHPAALLLD